MIIHDEVAPVFCWFSDLNTGAVFVSQESANKGMVFMKIVSAQTNYDEVPEDFNAICLNDGEPTYFTHDDIVREVCADLTITSK